MSDLPTDKIMFCIMALNDHKPNMTALEAATQLDALYDKVAEQTEQIEVWRNRALSAEEWREKHSHKGTHNE